MGKKKHIAKVEELFLKSMVVDSGSIRRIVNQNGSGAYAKQLLRNMASQNKIKNLGNGFYTTRNDPQLCVFCFKPAYLGLQDALSYHDLWEQETIPIILTSKKIRSGIRNVLGMNILVRKISQKYMFGYEQDKNTSLPYSDMEKTLIDLVHFKEKINPEIIAKFKKKINILKLNKYLVHYPKRTRNTVMNLME